MSCVNLIWHASLKTPSGDRARTGQAQLHQRTAFTRADPKSVKRYWWLYWVLTLWGATGVKAARKYFDEIDPQWASGFFC